MRQRLNHKIQIFLLKAWLHLAFSVLTTLSKASPPFPQRTCQRFARSAAKRDPHGSTISQIVDIMVAGSFDREFCLGTRATRLKLIPAIRAYLFQTGSGIDPRKPEPRFHPYIFAHTASWDGDGDPYAAFLRQGRPDGPWVSPLIEGGRSILPSDPSPDCRVALHVHAYHIDQFADILERLALNNLSPDLFISVKAEKDADTVVAALHNYRGVVSDIAAFPNRGRDIGPMLAGFGKKLLNEYDIIGHVHTKGRFSPNGSKWVADWSNFALSNTIGGAESGPMLDRIIGTMVADAKVGIVYPSDPHIPGWGVNKPAASEIAKRLGVPSLPDAFNFPIGTMFWVRSEAFRPFIELDLKWDDYPKEPIPNDGTSLHAIERLFGVVPDQNGWKTVLTHTAGVLR